MTLADIRRDYLGDALSETDSDPDPLRQFARWFEQIRDTDPDATAMALATVSRDGRPSVRTVLLKGVDDRGFVFYTNYDSRKARDIAETGRASLLFFWHAVERQVRISGTAEKVSAEESDAYFASRPLESRWSVYASHQSARIDSREALESRYDHARHTYGDTVPRPAWWGGYRVIPEEMEFWQGRRSRLHDRLLYSRGQSAVGSRQESSNQQPATGNWRRERLQP